ncbi:MAG: hypothetical protein HY904_05335 [Deltaproteobacteria bacterium]|nr:hypothetical protein [Deltaproteobacteria bacterium]
MFSRLAALLLVVCVATPVAAGSGWLCLCTGAVVSRCCCHGEDNLPPADTSVERTCCCSMEQGAPYAPAPAEAPAAEGTLHAPVLPPPPSMPLPVPARVSVHPVAVVDTGPPGDLFRLASVRLRP